MLEDESTDGARAADAGSPDGHNGLSRRAMLGRIGAGAAVAWTAPTILSATAASAATCQPASMDFTANAVSLATIKNGGTTSVPFGPSGSIDVTFDTTGLTSGTGEFDVDQPIPLGAAFADFGSLNMTGQSVGDFVELSFLFSTPVSNLTVTLLDVDLGESLVGPINFWTDRAQVTALNGASPVAISASTRNVTFVSNPSAGVFQGIFDPSGTGAGVPNTDPDANVKIDYVAPLDLLTIRYIAQGPGVEDQQIGVAFLDFCI